MSRLLLALLLGGCTTVHGVRPVGKGALSVEGSLGGPLTEVYGAPIPVPFSAVGATYGVSDRAQVHAAWHPSPTAFFNLFGADAGASMVLVDQDGARPRLMGDLTLTLIAGDNEPDAPEGGVRLFAQPTLNAAWDWGKNRRQTFYTGATVFTQPLPSVHALPALVVGQWWGAGPRLHLTTELKWIAPWQSSADLTPTYYAPGSLGAVAVQLGAGYRFGGAK